MADITLEQVRFWHEIKRDSFEGRGMPRDATDHAKMVAALDAAIKQREQDAKDAARYRWLAKRENGDLYMENPDKELLDRAIDAAMAKESANG
jgi:hypothetical protein